VNSGATLPTAGSVAACTNNGLTPKTKTTRQNTAIAIRCVITKTPAMQIPSRVRDASIISGYLAEHQLRITNRVLVNKSIANYGQIVNPYGALAAVSLEPA